MTRTRPTHPTSAKQRSDFTESMAQRLVEVTGDHSYREIARRTGFHAETVRRYMQGTSKQSLEFVALLANEFEADDSLLLRGHHVAPTPPALRLTPTADLVGELSRRLVDIELSVLELAQRIERAENHANLEAHHPPPPRATPLRLKAR